MEIQFIDITTYRGISSNADHFYAKIGEVGEAQEYYMTMKLLDDICEGVSFINTPDLIYYPSKQEAINLWEKDNGWNKSNISPKSRETAIDDLVKNGTIRFPSILSIIKTAKEKFPNALLVFSYCGRRKNFVNLLSKYDEKSICEMIRAAGVKVKENSNN